MNCCSSYCYFFRSTINSKSIVWGMLITLFFCWSCNSPDSFKSIKGTNYDKNSATGLVTNYHGNGKPASITKFVNGKKHGLARSYYESGLLKATVNYKFGVKQGEAKLYYKDGKLFRTSSYLDGELIGIRRKYRPNGMLLAEIPYSYGWEGIGLNEYLVSGELKKNYVPMKIDKIYDKSGEKLKALKVYFDGETGKREFYVGKLIEDKFLHNRLTTVEIIDGIGWINLLEFPQNIINKELTIVGKYTTRLKNPYIVQKTLQIR